MPIYKPKCIQLLFYISQDCNYLVKFTLEKEIEFDELNEEMIWSLVK